MPRIFVVFIKVTTIISNMSHNQVYMGLWDQLKLQTIQYDGFIIIFTYNAKYQMNAFIMKINERECVLFFSVHFKYCMCDICIGDSGGQLSHG